MSQGRMGKPLYVVVNGPSGSGKTTLGKEVASKLRLPLLSKDSIKEALMAEREVPVETSRQLGQAAMTSLMTVAHDSPIGAEAVWQGASFDAPIDSGAIYLAWS